MSKPIITVEHLSKRYHLGQIGANTLRDSVVRFVRNLPGKGKDPGLLPLATHQSGSDDLWALKDVSFDVHPGEILGVIGRNGAGKSTLLKLLSRITEPTSGRAIIRGRVASLLEVGTGFHPDLTGRDNVFLNGAILGMKKAEIARKFDEIVAFAEIEKFIDTPVKRYSSGMYVRLAFAVAAHLEPEILILDEVLAVGDAQFQQKCLGKVSQASKQGRTILFVSHNMAAILNLCTRVVLLKGGKLDFQGSASDAVSKYMRVNAVENVFMPGESERVGDARAKIIGFEVNPSPPETGKPAKFTFKIRRNPQDKGELLAEIAVGVNSERFGPLCHIYSRDVRKPFSIAPGDSTISVEVDPLPFAPGRYVTDLWMGAGRAPIDWIRDCFVLGVHYGRLGEQGEHIESNAYPVVVPSSWKCEADQVSS